MQLYEQWKKEGEKFELGSWINVHDPIISIHSLTYVLLKDDSPVSDVQWCVIYISRLTKLISPELCSDDVSNIIRSEKIGIIRDARICGELILSDSRLVNEGAKEYLLGVFNNDRNNYNVIRLVGWSRPNGAVDKLKNIFQERRSLWKPGDDWRSDKTLLWCTLALIRYDDPEALMFWRDRTYELSGSMLSYHGDMLPHYYYGDLTGMDMAYTRKREVVRIGADAIWNSKIKNPGGVFAHLSNVVAGFGNQRALFEEAPDEKTYKELVDWLLDKERKYVE
jgi:hypothetical protein